MRPRIRGDAAASQAEAAQSPLFNNSLAKGLSLLEAFGPERRTMNLPQMAAASGISKGAAQRLAFTLERLGYLRKDGVSKRYSLSPKLVELSLRHSGASSLIENATPYLLELNIACGESVHLSEPDGTDMVFVASFPGQKQISVHLPIGSRYPMYCTAAGRAYLAAAGSRATDEILRASTIVAYTPETVADPDRVRAMIEEARRRGYAYAGGEFFRGDINVAAPIVGPDGAALAAVSISVPVTRWTLAEVHRKLAPKVMQAARAASSPQAPRFASAG